MSPSIDNSISKCSSLLQSDSFDDAIHHHEPYSEIEYLQQKTCYTNNKNSQQHFNELNFKEEFSEEDEESNDTESNTNDSTTGFSSPFTNNSNSPTLHSVDDEDNDKLDFLAKELLARLSLSNDEEDVLASPEDLGSETVKCLPTTFDSLVKDIRAILGPSSGIDSADVDVEALMRTMRHYNPTYKSEQWERYSFADSSKGYTRNGVDECNAKANLLILVWSPGKGSLIHDHANAQ